MNGIRFPKAVAGVLIIFTFVLLHNLSAFPSLPDLQASSWPMKARISTSQETIPNKIWQVWLGDPIEDKQIKHLMSSWIYINQDTAYSRVSRQGAVKLVEEHFPYRPEIKAIVTSLQAPAVVSDLVRCLLLYAYGGYYGDIDTHVKRPVSEWLPPDLRFSKNLVVTGIEFDKGNATKPPPGRRNIALCNWAIAASPRHPLLGKHIDNAITNFKSLSAKYNATVDDLHKYLTYDDTLSFAGPRAWTGSVLDHIGSIYGRSFGAPDLTGMKKPQLHADVWVLPINGFGAGQGHSGSSMVDTEDTLVRHAFKGTWKHHGKKIE